MIRLASHNSCTVIPKTRLRLQYLKETVEGLWVVSHFCRSRRLQRRERRIFLRVGLFFFYNLIEGTELRHSLIGRWWSQWRLAAVNSAVLINWAASFQSVCSQRLVSIANAEVRTGWLGAGRRWVRPVLRDADKHGGRTYLISDDEGKSRTSASARPRLRKKVFKQEGQRRREEENVPLFDLFYIYISFWRKAPQPDREQVG